MLVLDVINASRTSKSTDARRRAVLSDSTRVSSTTMGDYDDFLPSFDDRPAQLLAADAAGDRVNDSSAVQSTAAAEVIGVALYPVVTWFAVLLTLSSVGLVGNVVVVVAASAMDGVGRRRRSSTAAVVNLSAALVGWCAVVGPFQFAVVAENYVKRSVAAVWCRAAAALYHLLAGAVVSSLLLYSVVRRRRLRLAGSVARRSSSRSRRSAGPGGGDSAAGTCSASCRRQLANLRSSSTSAGAPVDVLPTCRYSDTLLMHMILSAA